MIGWHQLRKDRMAILSIWLLALVALAGLFAPMLAPHDPTNTNILQKYAGISLTYPLGTDHLGRCVLSRLLYGIRTTMLAAMLTMCIHDAHWQRTWTHGRLLSRKGGWGFDEAV